jgi:hypothetical protein
LIRRQRQKDHRLRLAWAKAWYLIKKKKKLKRKVLGHGSNDRALA